MNFFVGMAVGAVLMLIIVAAWVIYNENNILYFTNPVWYNTVASG